MYYFRILPLARVVPGEKKERVKREKKKEEKICMRPDCVARREAFAEMNNENEFLRVKVSRLKDAMTVQQ